VEKKQQRIVKILYIANKEKVTNSIKNHDHSVEGDFGECQFCTNRFVIPSVDVIQSIPM
jgi:hypothetical protein